METYYTKYFSSEFLKCPVCLSKMEQIEIDYYNSILVGSYTHECVNGCYLESFYYGDVYIKIFENEFECFYGNEINHSQVKIKESEMIEKVSFLICELKKNDQYLEKIMNYN